MVDFESVGRGGEVNYFAIDDNVRIAGRTNIDQAAQKELEELAEFLINDGYFHIHTHDGKNHKSTAALAFLIEASKQLYKGDWKQSIEEIKQKITEIRQSEKDPQKAYKQTTWLLNQIIQNLYEKSLAISSLKAKKDRDPKKEVFFNRLFTQQKTIALLKGTIQDKDEPVPIGGIHPSLVPNWYKEMVINDKGKSRAVDESEEKDADAVADA